MRVVYVAGKYRGNVDENIAHAKREAIKLWGQGYAVICPHLNTANFDGLCPDAVWLEGDLEIIKRLNPAMDIIYMLKGWEDSKGATKEYELALQMGLSIMYE
jgi:hypothetical protein